MRSELRLIGEEQSHYNLTFLVRLWGDMHAWQMQEAKARLSEVVKDAESKGPQEITLHGRSVAVLVSRREFDRLTGMDESLVDFMRRSPLHGAEDIEFTRAPGSTREIEL